MKRLTAPLLVLIIGPFLVLPLSAAQIPQVDPAEKVYDFAGLLTREEQTQLAALAREIMESTGMDIAVASFDVEMDSVEEFAQKFYDNNGFGLDFENSGVLLVANMSARDLYITTTGYCVYFVDDDAVEKILDLVAPCFTQGEYYNGFRMFLEQSNHQFHYSSYALFPFTGLHHLYNLLAGGKAA